MFEELRIASEWLGYLPQTVPVAPFWGSLVALLGSTPGEMLWKIKVLSLVFYVIDAALLFFAVRNFFIIAVKRAERAAEFEEAHYEGMENYAGALIAGAFLITPGFISLAYGVSPLFVALFFPFAALYVVSRLVFCNKIGRFIALMMVAGVFCGISLWHGVPGIIYLPIVLLTMLAPSIRKGYRMVSTCGLALVGFCAGASIVPPLTMKEPLSDAIRVLSATFHSMPGSLLFPGSVVFLIFGIIPLFTIFNFVFTGRVRPAVLRRAFFGSWFAVVFLMSIASVMRLSMGEVHAGERFVDEIVANLGSRTVIVTDGAFDNLLRFKLPSNVIMVSLDAEGEVSEELIGLSNDEDARLIADLGSRAFIEEWLKKDPEAANKVLVICAVKLQTSPNSMLLPLGWCWAGTDNLGEVKVSELATNWRKAWNSIASALEGKDAAKWYMRRTFAVQGINLAELLASSGRRHEAEELRAFIAANIDSSFSAEATKRKLMNRQKLISSVERLVELDKLNMETRYNRIVEIERSVLPELEREIGDDAKWLVHVYRGDLELKKGEGVEHREKARDEYRSAAVDYQSDLNMVAGRLLLSDSILRDEDSVYEDAKAILRRDRDNPTALSLMGNCLANRGELVKAEMYLRRAIKGDGPRRVAPLNDLAEVLSRLGKYDQALELSNEAVELMPKEWNFRETRAALLLKMGKLEEGKAELKIARDLATEQGMSDIARDILDIDQARVLKLESKIEGTRVKYNNFLHILKERKLSPAHKKLLEQLESETYERKSAK